MATALITGASSGLGVHFARLFARDGHSLVLVARRKELLDDLAKELKVPCEVIAMDLGVPGAGQRLFEQVPQVDFLVNNAGFGSQGRFSQLPLARELQMLDLNIRTLVELTHLYLPGMLARRSGKILQVGSTAGFQPGPYMSTYYASKAFVNSFSEALNEELKGSGVSCTVLCPGATATEFAKAAGTEQSKLFRFEFLLASAPRVAQIGYEAMLRGQGMVVAGITNKLMVQMLRLSPRWLARKLAAQVNQA